MTEQAPRPQQTKTVIVHDQPPTVVYSSPPSQPTVVYAAPPPPPVVVGVAPLWGGWHHRYYRY